jgi:hypothetical protein
MSNGKRRSNSSDDIHNEHGGQGLIGTQVTSLVDERDEASMLCNGATIPQTGHHMVSVHQCVCLCLRLYERSSSFEAVQTSRGFADVEQYPCTRRCRTLCNIKTK